jgi:sugar phosphate isomerase/epimerase
MLAAVMSQQTIPALPTLAVSAKWFAFPDRFEWIAAQGFAAEYTPNPQALHLLPQHLTPFLKADVPVRHHGFFPDHEFGDRDRGRADRAMRLHRDALDAVQGYGEQVITLHIGVKPDASIDAGRVVEHLAHLVAYGRERGITVSIENLRRGPASHPETIAAWANEAGAMITLDVGHAVSNERVINGEFTVADVIVMFEDRLIEVHLYETESDRHYAPHDMRILGPIVDRLRETGCAWWTIELDAYADILRTRRLVQEYWG